VLELRRQQRERKGVGETQGSELACSHRSAAQVAVADRVENARGAVPWLVIVIDRWGDRPLTLAVVGTTFVVTLAARK
jgi:hypothetical protein